MVTVDLDAHVCPGGKFSNQLGTGRGRPPRRLHFSDPGADWVAQWLGPALTDRALISPVAAPTDVDLALRAGRSLTLESGW